MSSSQSDYSSNISETQPLLRAGTKLHVRKLGTGAVIAVLTVMWCCVDSWNHDVTGTLFAVEKVKNLKVEKATGDLKADIQKFQFPLTVALVQFLFMSLFFLCLWRLTSSDVSQDLAKVRPSSYKWGGMVTTHLFSTFFLQSLMMPQQMMSLGLFAASRAIEIPAAALLRSKVFNVPYGGHSLTTSILMFVAVSIVYYSYTQIEECLCIWSGYGVSLAGPPLFIIYALLLTAPAANAVCQEAVLVDHETHPLLVLALQNIASAALFLPVILLAHATGWENVSFAVQMIVENREVYMLVLWLCVQMAATSAIWIGLIYMVDSFWAVSLRSMRVVWWWLKELVFFYIFSDTLLSVGKPNASLWSFLMFCSVVLVATSMVIDQRYDGTLDQSDWEKQFVARQFPAFKAV
eukprot:gnl/MRDRNA2_/MRDRNA2_132897_c0_seq1.p1 gnl/MRDRNA2_/MRDRNA2_132897_c0~~gnl/MRDRNA2_/MRDRNA2_132897_c0_seq1.p1  ORF type:complete len:406 (-),score=54.27 gnl/MRDRNA2_/MRDRNA2_132897_c0_seq1:3-1220(-)